jgi:hypothetical protein
VAKARAKKDEQVDPDLDAGGGATPDPEPVGVTLLVDDDSLDDLDGVLRRVRKAGLRDGQVLAAISIEVASGDRCRV